ncbi:MULTISPECIES: DNA repair protein RecN [unclassified Adlercreutzia]|uniref:DNA repair protein RecN n=1 Tax=unclassified Adlercreutzia TaxID=2636013 RepID=UPI0013EA3F5B|nr:MULTISPECIES: DNA repair protein RecN [unclassified Adlercreutzia]
MIDEMQVSNLALIREASCAFSAGLTAFSGETGAGKTALLSACKLLMGARADKGAVREGEAAAQVSGRFFLRGEDGEGEREVVVTRRLSSDGRSRASIDGTLASVAELARAVAPSIDLVGQHEHQVLAKPSAHAGLLDAWARDEVGPAAAAYGAAFAAAAAASRELERIREGRTSSAAQLDEARFTLRQIDAVDPAPGEYEELVAYLDRAEHAEALARAADGAYQGLSGDAGALDGLSRAMAALEEGARYDAALEPLAQSLREAGYVLEDVAREALSYRDGVECDYDELASAQERAAAMQGLLRAYGPRMDDVLAAREAAREAVSLVDDAEERERAAASALEVAEVALAQAAEALHEARAAAAAPFARAVSDVMGRLEMGSAELTCEVALLAREGWTAAGPSAVELFFRPGAGMQARPLARIASGGEMSRVMLAIHVVMGERDGTSTLVFDEVDAGVGGATATALAQVLADLARTHQVLVVTHLAQVAVAADAHYVVEKSAGDVPETTLRAVEGEERVAEVARMLSGDATAASLAHAREMLGAYA